MGGCGVGGCGVGGCGVGGCGVGGCGVGGSSVGGSSVGGSGVSGSGIQSLPTVPIMLFNALRLSKAFRSRSTTLTTLLLSPSITVFGPAASNYQVIYANNTTTL